MTSFVGTGAGGGAALWRLCEQWGNNGKKIGVIEAGFGRKDACVECGYAAHVHDRAGLAFPDSGNGVVLQHRFPKVEIHYSNTAEDLKILDIAEEALNRFAAALGFGTTHFGRQAIVAGDHESCTCRMGDDPATSATNRFGQIHGVSGLFVADNSVLPYLRSANPTLTTVALAIRTADYIIRTTA
ncbi:GMC family oxidoreductase [Paenibacillus solisilvae]|uniref:GMC family oxidoreductase n=1 Tax=Paenibacillus solisilvae TaxID=2486751 RepID=A0ABW0VVB0_9BACL